MDYCNIHHRFMKFFLSYVFVWSGIFGIAGIGEAVAKEYFVAVSNGNDKNYGTQDAPFLTLEKGVSALSPGDTLFVRGGTYQRNQQLWNSPSGTSWTNAIMVKAYQNEKVIVKPLPSSKFPGNSVFYFKDNSQYIIMDGLILDGTNGGFGYVMGTGSHHIRVRNGEIKNTPNSAIQGSGADYIEIINLKIHDSFLGIEGYGPTARSYAFYLNGSYNLVQDCEIYNNHGNGIHIFSTSFKPSHNRIINNRIHNNGRAGVIVTTGTNNQVINNVIWGNEVGVHVDMRATNTIVYHNTIYQSEKYEIRLGAESNTSFVKNNLLVGTSSDPVILVSDGSGASIVENNLLLGNSKNPNDLLKIFDSSATAKDNLIGGSYKHGLKKIENYDFHITEASSAIAAGLVLPDVKTDMDRVPRNSTTGYDIGAYQFNNGLPLLEPPTSLRIVNK